MRYTTEIHLGESQLSRPVHLDLEQVRGTVAVGVNGTPVAHLVWQPWRTPVSAFLRPGLNRIELEVSNTLANLLEEYPEESGVSRVSLLHQA